MDKKRASYYNYYANKKWGDARYDICIDSLCLGIEGTIDLLIDLIQKYEENKSKDLIKEVVELKKNWTTISLRKNQLKNNN